MILAVRKAQVQRGVSQTRMQVQQKSFFRTGTGQEGAKLRCYCRNPAPALCANESHDMRIRSIFSFTAAAARTCNRLQQLIADKRLEQVFAATASHCLDDHIRLRVGRDREDSCIRAILANMLCHEECFAGVLVEIDETNVWT